ncbi:MAG: nucleotidyltransferase family protein [Dehalococcoidales bacterium]|nr:nucleotidyltransferase family protein [Dehalococcoidales bacterium]
MKKGYCAIILTAGLSSRMLDFKPLLPVGRETLADHVISTFLGVGVDVLLVTGWRREELVNGIKHKNIKVVDNPDYESGMFSSIKAGMSRLSPVCRAFFIMPVDIPLVSPVTIQRLLSESSQFPDRVIYPVFDKRRGHPPLIPSNLVPSILEYGEDGGLKAILSQHKYREVATSDSNILFDVDTPDDYQELLRRYQQLVSCGRIFIPIRAHLLLTNYSCYNHNITINQEDS